MSENSQSKWKASQNQLDNIILLSYQNIVKNSQKIFLVITFLFPLNILNGLKMI